MCDGNIRQKYRILVVDDEPGNVECFCDLLHSKGFLVSVASNGKQGVGLAKKINPSLVIMDWDMPGQNGLESVRILKDDEETSNIPVIMATGKMNTSEHVQAALDIGANDFVRKPLEETEVIARVRSMIRLSEKHKENLKLKEKLHQSEMELLASQLEYKQKKLLTTVMKLVEMQENTKNIYTKLESAVLGVEPEKKAEVVSIVNTLENNINSRYWDEFEMVFENMNPVFSEHLKTICGELTINEKRMCAFLKMDMENKQIASITNRSEEAVKKAKFRLKKKLGLKSKDDIREFVASL